MAKLKLSPPWDTYYQELNAMFKNDPTVHVVMDDDACEVKLYVDSGDKAEALQVLLPESVKFGNVTLKVTVVPANAPSQARYVCNTDSDQYIENMFRAAFEGNPALYDVVTVRGVFGFSACYVIFKKEVVQYFNDNLSDINGLCSTLYENIARDIFKPDLGAFYCTSANNSENLNYAFSW